MRTEPWGAGASGYMKGEKKQNRHGGHRLRVAPRKPSELGAEFSWTLHTRRCDCIKNPKEGHLGGSVVEQLPSAQVVISESWD